MRVRNELSNLSDIKLTFMDVLLFAGNLQILFLSHDFSKAVISFIYIQFTSRERCVEIGKSHDI